MAPTTKAGQKDNKRLDSVLGERFPRKFSMQNNAAYGNLTWQLAFAVTLEKTLRRAIQTLPALVGSIHRSIESIESIPTSAIASKSRDLDERGTTIWNLTSKYKEDATLAVALALAWASGLIAATDDIRVFKITLKASRWCLDQSQLGVTEQIIERAAFYDRRLQHAPQGQFTQELAGMNRRLCKEYQMLRVTLAWRRERLDLADIWWSKLDQEQNALDAPLREQLADTLFEVGRDQAKKQLYKPALQWLERAYDILIAHDQDDLGSDASALKNSIMHCQVHALLKEPCEENYSRAWNIIHELENEAENTVAVSLLKLSVLTGDPTAAQEYYNVLMQIIRQIHLSDVNVRTILHHVHALKQRNPGLAHTILVLFVSERLLVMGEIAWVEKTVVTLLWICTTSTNLGNMTDQLEELLNDVVARSNSAFGASATHAAQVLPNASTQLARQRRQILRCLKLCAHDAPSLIARLLVEELDSQQPQDQDCIDELCNVLDGAAAAAKENVFSTVELDWFSRNSYNLALRLCTLWKAESTLRIVKACSVVRDRLTRDGRFLQYYSELRGTVTEFRIYVKVQLSRLIGGARTDLHRKYACLITFDFEAAARLGSWASFGDLIEEVESHQDPKVFSIMADVILSCEAPTEVVITTLQQIVTKVWQPESEDIDRLARWIRCLLSLALSSKVEVAGKIVDQVISIVGNAKEVGPSDIGDQCVSSAKEVTLAKQKPGHYPAEELEWIATTAFNRAVDFYCTSQDDACRSWAGKAISLANLGDDHGQLHELLQNKYMGLAWDR
ncbi:MAG: hypothetical protein Q9210_001512 [Variospora velana]